MFSLIGLVIGTAVADVVILSVLGESLLATAVPQSSLGDPAGWWAALGSLRDPGIALASIVVGGWPGAMVGRRLAIRRLRRDRVDALLYLGTVTG